MLTQPAASLLAAGLREESGMRIQPIMLTLDRTVASVGSYRYRVSKVLRLHCTIE